MAQVINGGDLLIAGFQQSQLRHRPLNHVRSPLKTRPDRKPIRRMAQLNARQRFVLPLAVGGAALDPLNQLLVGELIALEDTSALVLHAAPAWLSQDQTVGRAAIVDATTSQFLRDRFVIESRIVREQGKLEASLAGRGAMALRRGASRLRKNR